jgi:hypothetical protein
MAGLRGVAPAAGGVGTDSERSVRTIGSRIGWVGSYTTGPEILAAGRLPVTQGMPLPGRPLQVKVERPTGRISMSASSPRAGLPLTAGQQEAPSDP